MKLPITFLLGLYSTWALADADRLGWIGPLSGPVAFLVSDNLKAIKLAIKEHQKIAPQLPVDLLAEDDQYNAKNTLIQFRRLKMEKGVRLFWVNNYSAMADLVEEAKSSSSTIINPIDNDETLIRLKGPYFLVAKKTEQLAALISDDILKRNISQVSILHFKSDGFMPRLASMVQSQLSKAHVKTIVEGYDKTLINFRPFLLNEMSRQSGAFVLLGYKELGEIIKQARTSGLSQPIYLPNINDSVTALAPTMNQGIRFTHFTEAEGNGKWASDFLVRFAKEYGSPPKLPWTAMQAYDSAMMLFAALKGNSKQLPTFSSLLSELRKLQPFEGVSGKLIAEENGSISGMHWALYEWKGKFSEKVSP